LLSSNGAQESCDLKSSELIFRFCSFCSKWRNKY